MINIAMCGLIVDVDWLLESAERIKSHLITQEWYQKYLSRNTFKTAKSAKRSFT